MLLNGPISNAAFGRRSKSKIRRTNLNQATLQQVWQGRLYQGGCLINAREEVISADNNASLGKLEKAQGQHRVLEETGATRKSVVMAKRVAQQQKGGEGKRGRGRRVLCGIAWDVLVALLPTKPAAIVVGSASPRTFAAWKWNSLFASGQLALGRDIATIGRNVPCNRTSGRLRGVRFVLDVVTVTVIVFVLLPMRK